MNKVQFRIHVTTEPRIYLTNERLRVYGQMIGNQNHDDLIYYLFEGFEVETSGYERKALVKIGQA